MEGLVSPLGLTPEMVAAEARRKLFELIEVPESEFTAEKKEHWREGAAMLALRERSLGARYCGSNMAK